MNRQILLPFLFTLFACTTPEDPPTEFRPVEVLLCHDLANRCLRSTPADEFWCKACVGDCPNASDDFFACQAWKDVAEEDLCDLSHKLCLGSEIYLHPSCAACVDSCDGAFQAECANVG